MLTASSLQALSSPVLFAIFLVSAAVIWIAGMRLTSTTDVLSQRWNLGSALGGAILLAFATNLPEIAITTSAALAGHLDVAVGNILGGIALQTVVLVAVDVSAGHPRKPLTHMAASLTLVVEAALVVALLGVVVMAAQLPATLMWWRLTPGVIVIGAMWVVGLVLIRRAGQGLPWQPHGHAEKAPAGSTSSSHTSTRTSARTSRALFVFTIAAAATLAAGVLIERSGEEVFRRWGMSGVVFGATVLAAATALPELSTGIASARLGNYRLAMSDIFGGNAFLTMLFPLAAVLSGAAVLPSAHRADIYLTALAGLLTVTYMAGLIFRPQRQMLRMGADSLAVLVLYIVGMVGLALVGG